MLCVNLSGLVHSDNRWQNSRMPDFKRASYGVRGGGPPGGTQASCWSGVSWQVPVIVPRGVVNSQVAP